MCYNPHKPFTVLSVHAKTKHNAHGGKSLVATRAGVDILSNDNIPDSTELKGNFFCLGGAESCTLMVMHPGFSCQKS